MLDSRSLDTVPAQCSECTPVHILDRSLEFVPHPETPAPGLGSRSLNTVRLLTVKSKGDNENDYRMLGDEYNTGTNR